jgi:HSP20 family protein
MPGLTPDEVDISIDGDRLTIRGELRPPLENVDYLFQERGYGPFSRTLTLNVPVNTNQAEAVFENGVLTLTLPKAEESKPRTIEVKRK